MCILIGLLFVCVRFLIGSSNMLPIASFFFFKYSVLRLVHFNVLSGWYIICLYLLSDWSVQKDGPIEGPKTWGWSGNDPESLQQRIVL